MSEPTAKPAACGTCVYFAAEAEYGACHRLAPAPQSSANSQAVAGWASWPRVLPDDWCGEFKAALSLEPQPSASIPLGESTK